MKAELLDGTEASLKEGPARRPTLRLQPDLVAPSIGQTAPATGQDDVDRERRIDSAIVGELLGLVPERASALVRYPGQAGTAALEARTCVALLAEDIGQSVVLLFDRGDPLSPIVMAMIRSGTSVPSSCSGSSAITRENGDRVIIGAAERLVLRCGEASLTLTRAGKLLIRGTYVSSHSSGVNKIKGGSVQLN